MRIESEIHLSEILRGTSVPVHPIGGGTRGVTAAANAEPLSLAALSGLVLYEPETLTLVARAGTPLAMIEQALADQKQQLAFEPPDWRRLLGSQGIPTIGAVIAANLSGPRRVQAGAARDACLGVRFVDGTGAIVKNGGRVMKNVTGYDLVKLMAGSWGSLGILTEVSLKVLPAPEAVATVVLHDQSLPQSVRQMAQALGSPWGVTGAARLPDGTVGLRLEGLAGSVAQRAERLADRLGASKVVGGAWHWDDVRDVQPFHGRKGDVWRFSVPAGDAPAIAARLGEETVLDWGGGLIWTLLPEGTDARALAAPYRGHAMLVRAAPETRKALARFEPEDTAVAALTSGLRAKFDPQRRLAGGV